MQPHFKTSPDVYYQSYFSILCVCCLVFEGNDGINRSKCLQDAAVQVRK